MIAARPNVLFLGVANACRSQMAEALLRLHATTRFQAYSAGLHPKAIHPLTHQVMRELNIDTTRQRSKPITEFLGRMSIRHTVMICTWNDTDCPRVYPFALDVTRWFFDDPTAFVGSEHERIQMFRRVRDEINERVQHWLNELAPIQLSMSG